MNGRARMRAARLIVVVAHLGCSRAALYAVTGGPTDGAAERATDASNPADGGTTDGSAASPGCQSDPLSPGDTSRTVQVGSVSRTYVLHVPPAFDGKKPAPLV